MKDDIKHTSDLPIKYFKLITGESIIGYVYDSAVEDGAVLKIEEPMVVSMNQHYEYELVPWFPFSINNLHCIDVYNILSEDDVADHIKKIYMRLVLEKYDTSEAVLDDEPIEDPNPLLH
jgi:hypothetical protein